MRRILIIGSLMFVGAAPLNAQVDPATPVKALYAMRSCASDPAANTTGIVNIVLPEKFDGKPAKRQTGSGSSKKNKVNWKAGSVPADSDDNGEDDYNANNPTSTDQYDVFLQNGDLGTITNGFVMVRVLTEKSSHFEFDTANPVLLSYDPGTDTTLCTSGTLIENIDKKKIRQAAIFYLDMDSVQKSEYDFTIKLQTQGNTTAPMLIDPKIRNDIGF